ncbi:MAG: LCP family protein [Microcoleaceae cyanobacterium]
MTSPHHPRSVSLLRRWLILGCIILIAGGSAALGMLVAWKSQTEAETESTVLNQFWRDRFAYDLSRPINILVMGIDPVPNSVVDSEELFKGRSDTLLLVRFDKTAESINVLSIPRDTEVEIPGFGWGKINEANYWGGVKLATEVIQENLNQVPIDRYIRVSSGAFKELVDLLGGVEVFVPQVMSYIDQTQQLKIDLSPGWQTINGEQADQFVRFRGDGNGDIGRVQRQQALLQAVQERLNHPTVLPRLPQIIRVLQKYIDTNLSFEELMTMASFGLKLEESQVKMVILPGEGSNLDENYTSYWVIDELERDRIMHQFFQQDSKDYLLSTLESSDPEFPFNLKIAIQNASGNANTDEQILDYFNRKGFYNTYLVSDWPDEQQQTQIIAQQGDLKSAELLQELLEFGEIEAASIGAIGSELTLRIGKDWLARSQR